MRWDLIITILTLLFGFIIDGKGQDDPSGYTNNYGFRMWSEGAYPTDDSINQNLIDIDGSIFNRDLRIDSLKTAFTWMFNFPSGTWKRYDSNEFDNDTLKVKSGVFPKLSLANTYSSLQTFQGGEVKFDQDFGTVLNFEYDNDLGGIFFRKNSSTALMEFDESDGMYWQMLYPLDVTGDLNISGSYKINGVPISTGGGDAYLNLPNHFTTSNTWDDSIIAQTGQVENATVSDILRVTGDVATDLNFAKGSNTWLKTIDNYKLFLGANNDTAIEVSTGNDVRVHENLDVDGIVNVSEINASNTISNSSGITMLYDLTVNNTTDVQELSSTYIKQGVDATYVATKTVKGKITATNAYVNMPHGLVNYKKIIGLQLTILRDTTGTTNKVLSMGYNMATPMNVGSNLSADTTNVIYYVLLTSTALIDDSVKVLITYEK